MPTSSATHRRLILAAWLLIAICGGSVLGIASAHRAYFDSIVFIAAGFLGALVGLATAPLVLLATENKDWRTAIPAIYVPSLLAALITSDKYNPLLGAAWTVGAFVVACAFCWLLIPNMPPSLNEGYRHDHNRLIARFLPFLLIPVASIGFRAIFGPADLSSMSITQLTRCLAANDVHRRDEATQELASRGMGAIQQLVHHENANVRRSVARAVRSVRDEDAAEIIRNYLSENDRYVRLEAIWAIQYDFGPSLLPALEDRLQREADSRVKEALVEAIAYLKIPHANHSAAVRQPE
jgi:hypothetical protein